MLDWFRTLEQALAAWHPADHTADLEAAEAERADFLARFPRTAWAEMPLKDYALGTGDDSVGRRLEYHTKNLGSLPARSAATHLIYREKDGAWRWPAGYASLEDAWAAIRQGFVQALSLAEAGELGTIDRLPTFQPGRNVVHKILHVYFPDAFLPISANTHLQHFARRVLRDEWNDAVHRGLGHCELGALVIERLHGFPALSDAPTTALMRFLYGWSDPRTFPTVLKVAPGEGAKHWDDCRESGVMRVGWEATGDLTPVLAQGPKALRDVFSATFDQLYNSNKATLTKKAAELHTLCTARPGTIVLANRGTGTIVGVGQVIEPGYHWRSSEPEYNHAVAVRWDVTTETAIPPQAYWAMVTVQEIPPQKLDEILGPVVGTLPGARTTGSWIFQCNPKYYDLARALREEREISWRAAQGASKMHVGDRVFLWQSGAEAGVVASCILIDGPTEGLQPPDPYSVPPGDSGPGPWVRLRIDLVLMPVIGKSTIKQTPALADLTILVMPMQTNYPLTPAQAHALAALVDESPIMPPAPKRLPFDAVLESLRNKQLHFSDEAVANFLLALQTRRFVLLTGISGTGKTQLAMAVADGFPLRRAEGDALLSLGLEHPGRVSHEQRVQNVCVVAVRPDWTDNRGLLGYANPLTRTYVSTPFLELLLAAVEEERAAEEAGRSPQPFFVVLDEMNLARVEHYFSDFLSALESDVPIHLHSYAVGSLEGPAVPGTVRVPRNLFVVGTVNIDETTYSFSPKVLDRAFAIELNDVRLGGFGASPEASALALDQWDGTLRFDRRASSKDWENLGRDELDVQTRIGEIHEILSRAGRPFGYRVAYEIARFVLLARAQATHANAAAAALDLAVLQKVLPKLGGTRSEMESLLDQLLVVALGAKDEGEEWKPGGAEWKPGVVPAAAPLPRTARRLWRMWSRAKAHGFVAFVE